jgi:hypothetical protein
MTTNALYYCISTTWTQGIILWISQNPLWASLQSPNIQEIKHIILSTSEDLRNLIDIPSHSPVPVQYSFTYTLSLSPVEVLTGDSRRHQKITVTLTATIHPDVCD